MYVFRSNLQVQFVQKMNLPVVSEVFSILPPLVSFSNKGYYVSLMKTELVLTTGQIGVKGPDVIIGRLRTGRIDVLAMERRTWLLQNIFNYMSNI